MNRELIETVESLGGTALMGGILIQFSDTAFEQALKKIYEAGVEAEREACAKVCDGIAIEARTLWKARYEPHNDGRSDGAFECVEAIRARGQA